MDEFRISEAFDGVRELLTGRVWDGSDGASECAAAVWALLERCIEAEKGSPASAGFMQLVGVASGELSRAPWPEGFRKRFRSELGRAVEEARRELRDNSRGDDSTDIQNLTSEQRSARLAKLEYLRRMLVRSSDAVPVS